MTFHRTGISLFHALLPLGLHQYLSKGETLPVLPRNPEDRQVHLVGDGLVKIIIIAEDGRRISAKIARQGDILTSYIPSAKAEFTAGKVVLQAITSSNLLTVSQAEFDALLLSNPSFAVEYFEQLTRWQQLSALSYSERCNGRGVGRIRSALHAYASSAGCAFEENHIAIRPSRSEIAQLAGLSLAHTIRLIQKMASDGEIHLDGKIIRFQSDQFGPASHYQWDSALFFDSARSSSQPKALI